MLGCKPTLLMTKSHLTLFGSLAVILPVVAFQFYQNSKLREEIASIRGNFAVSGEMGEKSSQVLRSSDAKGQGGEKEKGSEERERSVSLEKILADSDPMNRIRGMMDYVDVLAVSEIPES